MTHIFVKIIFQKILTEDFSPSKEEASDNNLAKNLKPKNSTLSKADVRRITRMQREL